MNLATAFIEIRADTSRALADAKRVASNISNQKADIDVSADTKQAESQTKALGKKIEDTDATIKPEIDGRQADTDMRALAGRLSRTFIQYFGAAAFGKFVADSIKGAAELEQAIGGTTAIFKEFADEVDGFAQQSAESVGLSEKSYRQLATVIGSSLKNAGVPMDELAGKTNNLIETGADLAAMFGGTTADAVAALSSALRGEFDPIERYGITLTAAAVAAKAVEMGLATTASEVDNYGKKMATLAIIQEQSADAAGQFAREQDTAAGSAQILSAKFEDMRDRLGTSLLPIFTQAVEMATKLADAFSSLPQPVQTAIVAMAGLAIVSGPIKNLVMAVGGLSTMFTKMKGAVPTIATAAPIVAFASLAIGAFLELQGQAAASEKQIEDFANSMSELDSPIEGLTSQINMIAKENDLFARSMEAAGVTTREVAAAALEGGNAWSIMSDKITAGGDSIKGSVPVDELNEVWDILDNLPSRADRAEQHYRALDKVQSDVGTSAEEAATGVEDLGTATEGAGDSADEMVSRTETLIEGLTRLRDAAVEYNEVVNSEDWGAAAFQGASNSWAGFTEHLFGMRNLVASQEAAFDDLAGAVVEAFDDAETEVKEFGSTFSETTEGGRAGIQALQGVMGSLGPSVAAAFDGANGSFETFASTMDGIRYNTIAGLTASLMEAGYSAEDASAMAGDFAAQMGLLPENYELLFKMSGQDEALVKLQLMSGVIDDLPAEQQMEVIAMINDGDFIGAVEKVTETVEAIPDESVTEVREEGAEESTIRVGNLILTVDNLTGKVVDVHEEGAKPSDERVGNLIDEIRRLTGKTVDVEEEGAQTSRIRVGNLDLTIDRLTGKVVSVYETGATPSSGRVGGLRGAISALSGKTVSVGANVFGASSVSSLKNNILGLTNKTVTVTARLQGAGMFAFGSGADGGIYSGLVKQFANGGLNARIQRSVSPRGIFQWAEPETGGEAFIPLARAKRDASLRIWAEVGRMFGVLGQSMPFADGGINQSRFASMPAPTAGAIQASVYGGGSSQAVAVRPGNVQNFVINSYGTEERWIRKIVEAIRREERAR